MGCTCSTCCGNQLGIDTALRDLLGARRFTTDMERVLFALVANRALDPTSKRVAAEWAVHDVAIDGLKDLSDDQAYRAMDLLVEADAKSQVQEAVFFAVANLLNLDVDVILFDTTSTYFETDLMSRLRTGSRGSAGTAIPRITAPICRRSSSVWP